MLTPPERRAFKQLRARWEFAQLSEEQSANMVGRKVSQQPVPDSAGSKFRRKLSHGLASISNTLSARKTTPGRVAVPLAVSAAATATSTFTRDQEPLSPTPQPKPVSFRSQDFSTKTAALIHHQSPTRRATSDATPNALPRARTTSFLPRPVKLEHEKSAANLHKAALLHSPRLMASPKLRSMPSKIPTPSPPLSERKGASPRQYLSHHASIQDTSVAASYQFAVNSAGSPSKGARSHTTPNLLKATIKPQPQTANFMAPRRPGVKRATRSSPVPKPTLQENIPTNKRVSQVSGQLQEKTSRRGSLAVDASLANRRSFGPSSTLAWSTQSNLGSPLTAKKRMSSNLATQTPTTPVTAKRAHPSTAVVAAERNPLLVASSGSIEQARLMGPKHPPTPTPNPVIHEATGPRPELPRSHTDKDLQRKTLGTPNGLGGVWRSSRALGAANHEVSLPRSSTFHNFGRCWEATPLVIPVPPVPPIPHQYRTPSLSHLIHSSIAQANPSHKYHHARMASDATSCESIPEEKQEDATPLGSIISSFKDSGAFSFGLSDLSDDLVAPPPPRHLESSSSVPLFSYQTGSHISLPLGNHARPWSISDRIAEDSANGEPCLQVRDYMPILYWAGRFQSRYDQWRTEAMYAELDHPIRPPEGLLSGCKLSQEKLAACYIFGQLRDLCLTDPAADSLWVSGPSTIRQLFTLYTYATCRTSSRAIASNTSFSAIRTTPCDLLPSTAIRASITRELSGARSGS